MNELVILRLLTDHPRSVGESYLVHLRRAGVLGLTMGVGALACLVHAILPFLFVHTASDTVDRLQARFATRDPYERSP